MGVNSSSPPKSCAEIVLVGNGKVGKTHFLDLLVFQEYTTLLPTVGTYHALYNHAGRYISFCEEGGSTPFLRTRWELYTTTTSLWIFIDPDTSCTELALQRLHGQVMLMLATASQRVCLCLVLNLLHTDVLPNGHEWWQQRLAHIFQLRALGKMGYPARIMTLNHKDLGNWGQVVEMALDWVLDFTVK